jgi:hypothetical protein
MSTGLDAKLADALPDAVLLPVLEAQSRRRRHTRSVMIHFRMTDAEYQDLVTSALHAGLRLSEYCRQVLLDCGVKHFPTTDFDSE